MASDGAEALIQADLLFMGDDPVHQTLRRVTGKFEQLKIPYTVIGGMALVAHGYVRTTTDVNVLITENGLNEAHKKLDGLRYIPLEGSRNLRDTQTGVRIEFVVTGEYPGDAKPKPVAFPQPEEAAVSIDGMWFVNLNTLIEFKLVSGLTNPARLRDLADVQELIRILDFRTNLRHSSMPTFSPINLSCTVRQGTTHQLITDYCQ